MFVLVPVFISVVRGRVIARRRCVQSGSMQSQRSLKAPSSAPCVVLRPQARRPRCLAAQAAASAVSICTKENAGDETWNKTYYPKLADTAKVEKDWCALSCRAFRNMRRGVASACLWCCPRDDHNSGHNSIRTSDWHHTLYSARS